jgi:hypothetical protein
MWVVVTVDVGVVCSVLRAPRHRGILEGRRPDSKQHPPQRRREASASTATSSRCSAAGALGTDSRYPRIAWNNDEMPRPRPQEPGLSCERRPRIMASADDRSCDAYVVDDDAFFQWYGPWSPPTVREVSILLGGFEYPWWIVGGHAIELFTGVPRHHDDIDVVILRPHATQLLQVLAPNYHAWANASGTLTPMLDGRLDLPANAAQIWVRRDAQSPWEIDFSVADERDGNWVWRHDRSIAMTLGDVTWINPDGVQVSRPEIVLAHKAKWRQPKDDADFDSTWPLLDVPAKTWLRTTVTTMYPDHPWLAQMD